MALRRNQPWNESLSLSSDLENFENFDNTDIFLKGGGGGGGGGAPDVQFSVTVPGWIVERLDAEGGERGLPREELIVLVVREYFDPNGDRSLLTHLTASTARASEALDEAILALDKAGQL